MHGWQKQIQIIVNEIDNCILNHHDEALTLSCLSTKLGYSEFYTTRKFKEISGMQLRDYINQRQLAFALKELRDTDASILEIAVNHGYASHEAFTRAFKRSYGITPSAYRNDPKPVILRTKINPFDRYLFGYDELGRKHSSQDVQVYYVTIPAHKFLYIENKESNGFWDFWQKQNQISGQDINTICGLLDSIKGKLDDNGGSESNSSSGQLMAYRNDPNGRLCAWGFPRTECYGIRLPYDYDGEVPAPFTLTSIPEGSYIVFEHGPFDYEQENRTVETKLEAAMTTFEQSDATYAFDTKTPGKIIYFYHDPERFAKYIRPIYKITN